MLEIILLCLFFLVVIFFVLNFTKTVAAAEPVHAPLLLTNYPNMNAVHLNTDAVQMR